MPEGDSSYYRNAVESPKDKYEDYITKDLIADVENRFPTGVIAGAAQLLGYRWADLRQLTMHSYARSSTRL
jgi:hypothetical protein